MSEALDIAGILFRTGHTLKAGTVNQILKVDGDVMPGIKDPDQLPRQVPILASSHDLKNDPRGVFRHIFTGAALTQVTDGAAAKEILDNHDKHFGQVYNDYAKQMKAEGKPVLSYNQILNGSLVQKPKNWSQDRFRDFMDTAADLGNNNIGYALGHQLGGNYDRNLLAREVGNVMAKQGGYLARFNDKGQARIQVYKITTTQNSKISRRAMQLFNKENKVPTPQPGPRPTPSF